MLWAVCLCLWGLYWYEVQYELSSVLASLWPSCTWNAEWRTAFRRLNPSAHLEEHRMLYVVYESESLSGFYQARLVCWKDLELIEGSWAAGVICTCTPAATGYEYSSRTLKHPWVSHGVKQSTLWHGLEYDIYIYIHIYTYINMYRYVYIYTYIHIYI